MSMTTQRVVLDAIEKGLNEKGYRLVANMNGASNRLVLEGLAPGDVAGPKQAQAQFNGDYFTIGEPGAHGQSIGSTVVDRTPAHAAQIVADTVTFLIDGRDPADPIEGEV